MASNSNDDIEIISASPKVRAPFTSQNTTTNTQTTKIKVYVRIRPIQSNNERKCAEISEDGKHVSMKQQEPCSSALDFACDRVFGEQSTQKEVYETIASSMLPKFFEGRNVCVFAYGQTGSGKTHSMLGGSTDPGMLRRFGREMFETVLMRRENETTEIQVSFYEIYKEKAYDLLSRTNVREALRLRGTDTAYLEGLTSIHVTNQLELEQALNKGLSKRVTAATLVNSLSSRSHAIFQISLCRNQKETVDGVLRENRMASKWCFVDLAGSECLKMAGQNGYENKGETKSINCSLLALQKIIEHKSQGSSSGYASYRESVLTYLLKECFGGNSVTSLLATISPEQQYVTQSIATLRFASKAAKVQQASRQNVDPLVMVVKGLKAENYELQAEVQRLRNQTQLCKSTSTTNSTFTSPPTVLETPCIVEVVPDKQLNQTFKIPTDETGMELSAAAEENPSVRFLYQQPPTKSQLIILRDNVAVNGDILHKDSELELTHGDKIVLGGLRFLVFVDRPNATMEECVPSYEKVKLEFVESTFPIANDKLIKQAREEFLSDKDERLRELNKELEHTKQELESLKAAERPLDKNFHSQNNDPAVVSTRLLPYMKHYFHIISSYVVQSRSDGSMRNDEALDIYNLDDRWFNQILQLVRQTSPVQFLHYFEPWTAKIMRSRIKGYADNHKRIWPLIVNGKYEKPKPISLDIGGSDGAGTNASFLKTKYARQQFGLSRGGNREQELEALNLKHIQLRNAILEMELIEMEFPIKRKASRRMTRGGCRSKPQQPRANRDLSED